MQEIIEEYLEDMYNIGFKVEYLDIRKYWIETKFILNNEEKKIGFVFSPDYNYTEDYNCRYLKELIDKAILRLYIKL